MNQTEIQLEFLYRGEEALRDTQNSLASAVNRQKLMLFLVSITFLSVTLLSLDASQISIVGITIEKLAFNELTLAVPFLLTYQFVLYAVTRLRARIVSFKHDVVIQDIENKTGLNLRSILRNHSYTSRRGNYIQHFG